MSLSMAVELEVRPPGLLKRLWKQIALTAFITRSNILSAMEYRASFLTQVVGMVVNDAAFTVLWYFYFQSFPSVNGWAWHDTALLLAISTFTFGITFVLARGALDIARTVRQGELDYFLAFPKDVLWHVSISRTQIDAIGDLLFGAIMFLVFCKVTIVTAVLFVLAASLGAVVSYAFVVATQSLAFYVSNFEDAGRDIFELLLGFSFYPQNIFGGGLHVVMLTIIPAFFATTMPFYLVRAFKWEALGVLAVAAAIALTLATAFFRYSLKRYESGNLIAVRV